jgi:protein CpxP
MKKLILIFLCALGLNLTAIAQQRTPPTPEEITKKSVDELEKRLKLNSTQKSIIYNFTYAQVKEQQEIINKQNAGGGDNEKNLARYYKLQDEATKNIRSVLKEDQLLEFEKMLQERVSGKDSKKKKKKKEEDVVTDLPGISR